MKTPTIEHHEFGPTKPAGRLEIWTYLGSSGGILLAYALLALFREEGSAAELLTGAGAAGLAVLAPWLLSALGFGGGGDSKPLLRIGPQGIRDWRLHARYIPWHRIAAVEPETSDPQAYGDFAIAIDGPNLYSSSAALRFFHNAVTRPLGRTPRLTISFGKLDAGEDEAAALVRTIVAAARGEA